MDNNATPRICYPHNVHEIGLRSLIYVSRSSLPISGDAAIVEEIVRQAVARNTLLGITGALIYTELHFAQVLEGSAIAIRELMSSIRNDPRHCDVTVVHQQNTPVRHFATWSMAYNGPSAYLDRHVKPLVGTSTAPRKADEMVDRLLTNTKRLYQLANREDLATAPPPPAEAVQARL